MTHHNNHDLIEDLTANIAHAAWIAAHIDDWTGYGRSTTGNDGGHTHVSDSDPTYNAATATPNPTDRLADAAMAQLEDLDHLRQITNRMNSRRHGTLNRMDLADAKDRINERTTPSTIGFCEGCDRNCTGETKYESIIAGLCGACRQAFDRWDKGDDRAAARLAFVTQRRQQTTAKRRRAS